MAKGDPVVYPKRFRADGQPILSDIDCSNDPPLTKQAFKDEVDINKIIAQFDKTGMITKVNGSTPFYGDVSDIVDYQTSLNIVQKARDLFAGMDANVRERFSNDPDQMIKFLQDPSNLDEAVKLGMVVKRPVVPVEPPIVVPPVVVPPPVV